MIVEYYRNFDPHSMKIINFIYLYTVVGHVVSQTRQLTKSDESFPWGMLSITIVAWLLPLLIYSLYSAIFTPPSGLVTVTLLLLLVCLVPVAALILYLTDKRREDGYVTVWGYK